MKRLSRIMPYKPENITGSKHCQMTNCQSVLKYKRCPQNSKSCNMCTVIVEYSCYSCTSGLHEYHVCKDCYALI